jgi:hypothetical protein
MENNGRPLDMRGGTDYQEVQRRYQLENPDDINKQLENDQKQRSMGSQNGDILENPEENIPEENKMPYIKGDV